jgi:DNA invertase Pin-like site-specific DNA recombinase
LDKVLELFRPGKILEDVLQHVENGTYEGIIVSKLDRLSRSVVQANEIHDRLEKAGGALIALDLQIDTSTATGRLLMNLIATVAQWERDTIGERTRSALRAKRARGEQVGRKRVISDVVRGRVHELRAQGFSYREIGEHLLAEGHRPPSGLHRWQISTIQRLLQQEVAQPRVPS